MKKRTHTVHANGVYSGRYSDFTLDPKEARTMTYQEAVNYANRVREAGGTATVVPATIQRTFGAGYGDTWVTR